MFYSKGLIDSIHVSIRDVCVCQKVAQTAGIFGESSRSKERGLETAFEPLVYTIFPSWLGGKK